MREIKFRVWDEEAKNYAPIGCVFGFLATINPYSNETICQIVSSKNHEYSIEQFTGLHDKNGKEIYEGDIIVSRNDIKYVVEWSKENAMFFAQTSVIEYRSKFWNESIVIGNIHENPERLS